MPSILKNRVGKRQKNLNNLRKHSKKQFGERMRPGVGLTCSQPLKQSV